MPGLDRVPADLRALADQASRIVGELIAIDALLRDTTDGPFRRVGWRLDETASSVRRAGADMIATATVLAFVLDVRNRPHCDADWGCCPEHGATLTCSGGGCRCTAPGCGRSWDWDRMGLPCDEPPAFSVQDAAGKEATLCSGHAVAARRQLDGARWLPFDASQPRGESVP